MSIELHHCTFGSSRRKPTRLIHNIESYHHLNQLCDNQRKHEPWGRKPDGSWATAEETAYPWPLARAIATQVVVQLQCHLPSFAEQECTLQALRASTNVQPRKILSSLVLEFKQLLNQPDSSPLPPHAGKLSTPKLGYVASAPENHITVGVHFSQEEFLQEALRLQHPTEQQALFPREVRTNVSYLTSQTVHQVARERTEQVRRWTTLATELLDEERKMKASLSPRIAEVLKDETLALRLAHSRGWTRGLNLS